MREAPGSLESLRANNRTRVLAVLQVRGAASQAEIARETGLSPATVSTLVAKLLTDGLVERTDALSPAPTPSGGRPPTLLTLNPSSGGFVGIDFGRGNVRVAVANRAGVLLADARRPLDVAHEAQEALDTAERVVPALLEEADIKRDRVLGAGVAVSAPVRADAPGFASGVIFPAWADIDVAEVLSERLGMPVHLGNDANLGALAEVTFGAARGFRNILYAMLSEGIGGALVIDGRLYIGETGTAGELGHVVVNPDGQVCRCGARGCLATVAGGAALTEALRQTHGTEIYLDDVLALVQQGDAGAVRVVADAGRAVGRVLAGMCALVDPGLVVIGGELTPAGDALLHNIQESLDQWISPAAGRRYRVALGELGARAEVLGAIALAMNHVSGEALERIGTGAEAV